MDHETNESDAFLSALQSGDRTAWQKLFSDFGGLIRSIVSWSKWRFDSHVQEDVVQNISSDIVKSVSNLRNPSGLIAFIKRICVRRCIDEIRQQIKHRTFHVPLTIQDRNGHWAEADIKANDQFDPVRAVIMTERVEALRRVLEELGEKCQTSIRQFYEQDLSYKEMAVRQKISINTVGSRLAKCLEKLRALIQKSPILKEAIEE